MWHWEVHTLSLDLRPLYDTHCAGKLTFTCEEIPELERLIWVDEATGAPLAREKMTPRQDGAQH